MFLEKEMTVHRKSEALEWERNFKLKEDQSISMSCKNFVDIYLTELEPRIKRNTFYFIVVDRGWKWYNQKQGLAGYVRNDMEVYMRLGEVGLLTNDVVKLADFYKALLEINNDSNDEMHQTIIAEETMLTIYNDGSIKNNNNQNMCIAFTVDNIEKEYQKVLALGAEMIEKPTKRPWGTVNMSFYDPDRNVIYLRSFFGR